MVKIGQYGLKALFSLILVAGLWLTSISAPAFSQQDETIQNLIVNGGFEEGFQGDFGVGYGWGAFSNGNAAMGWNSDTWEKVVAAGSHAQLIEIKNANDRDRYAGIYQTIAVVPGQQYKLTIKGMIRSEEGDINASNYGYRLQYGVDYEGGATWELVNEQNWQEIPWDEQPLNEPSNGVYRLDTFETTLTAKSNKLTLFIRAWKKWLNNGVGLYDVDEISLVGPAPAGFQATTGQVASVGNSTQANNLELVSPDPSIQTSEHDGEDISEQAAPETAPQATATPPAELQAAPQATPAPQATAAQLPVSGQGRADSLNYIGIMAVILLLVLFSGAITTMVRRRRPY